MTLSLVAAPVYSIGLSIYSGASYDQDAASPQVQAAVVGILLACAILALFSFVAGILRWTRYVSHQGWGCSEDQWDQIEALALRYSHKRQTTPPSGTNYNI